MSVLTDSHGYRQIGSMDDNETPVTVQPYVSDELLAFHRLDEEMAEHSHPFGPADPPSGGTFRRVGMTASRLPSRVSRRRESHGRQPGHRRVRSTRAGPDEPAPSDEPALGRHTSSGVAL